MEKKEDRRIAMTKRLLKAALIELLKEQDIYHISIRELCERADVNRTTFYKYYGSQFDLLTDMEKDMLDFSSIGRPATWSECSCVMRTAERSSGVSARRARPVLMRRREMPVSRSTAARPSVRR